MTRTQLAVALVFAGSVALPFAGCNGEVAPTGATGNARGAFTGGGWACACPNGATDCLLTCPDSTGGRCTNGQPYCGVTQSDAGLACACANGQSTCSLTCPDGTAGTCAAGTPTCGAGADAGPRDAGGGNLAWYVTCGDPVCREPVGDGGSSCVADSASCPAVGSACTTKGQTCNDCKQGCGARVVCDDHDPTHAPGGCPISSRKFKENIGYLGDGDLARLHDEAMRMRLATYNYKDMYGNPFETHLGFIVEDNPQSFAVDQGHDRVDIYGYLSIALASIQIQQKEIDELRAKVAACKR